MTDGCLPRQSRTACKQTVCGVTGLAEGFSSVQWRLQIVPRKLITGMQWISVIGRTRLVMIGANRDKSH